MKTCPTCGQTLPDPRAPKRICTKCGKPIRLRDKWRFGRSGPEHKDCRMPAGTGTAGQDHQRIFQIVEPAEEDCA